MFASIVACVGSMLRFSKKVLRDHHMLAMGSSIMGLITFHRLSWAFEREVTTPMERRRDKHHAPHCQYNGRTRYTQKWVVSWDVPKASLIWVERCKSHVCLLSRMGSPTGLPREIRRCVPGDDVPWEPPSGKVDPSYGEARCIPVARCISWSVHLLPRCIQKHIIIAV